MEKIAIYWGAFNPPTIWHKELIVQTLTSWQVDRIIFSPDWRRKDKDFGISDSERIEMIKRFADELCTLWLNIDFHDYFLKREWNTSTLEVDRYYKEKLWESPYHIFWIDTVSSMPRRIWNENGYIEKHLKKIFIERKGFELPKNFDMQNYIILSLDIPEVSSTIVRELIKNKQKVTHILTPWVYEYAVKNGLYQ